MIYAYDPQHLINILTVLLPTAEPGLATPTDAVAALVHAIQTALDYKLVSPASDPPKISPDATPSDDDPPRVGRPKQIVNGPLKEGWNAKGEDLYTFEYADGAQDVYRIRVGRLGGRVQVSASVGDGEPSTLSVVLADLVDSSVFPVTLPTTDPEVNRLGFLSKDKVQTFAERYKNEISIPLYEQTKAKEPSGSGPTNPPARQDQSETAARLSPDLPNVLPGTSQSVLPAGSVGHRDLDPIGLGQRPGRGGAFNPDDGGGMLMDFNHPLFDSRRRGEDPDFSGPGGSIQPPGARWDPVGPGFQGVSNPQSGRRNFGDELPPPGQFGPDLGGLGGLGGFGGGGIGGGGGGIGRGGVGGPRFGGGGGGGGGGFGGMYM